MAAWQRVVWIPPLRLLRAIRGRADLIWTLSNPRGPVRRLRQAELQQPALAFGFLSRRAGLRIPLQKGSLLRSGDDSAAPGLCVPRRSSDAKVSVYFHWALFLSLAQATDQQLSSCPGAKMAKTTKDTKNSPWTGCLAGPRWWPV